MSEFPMNSIDIEGETLEIRPRGKFGKTITEAYAELMARIAMEPLGDVVQKFVDDNPGMTLAEAQTLATKSRADEAVTKMQVGVLKVVAGTNLLYQLAGDALGKDLEWAEENLDPGQVARIVKQAKEIGGIGEYLAESLSFLMTAGAGDEAPLTPSDTDESSPDASKDSLSASTGSDLENTNDSTLPT